MLLVIKSCRCDHIKLLLYLFFSFINNTTSAIQAGFRFHCLGFQTHNEKCCRHWYVLSSCKIALIIKYCKPIIIRACNQPERYFFIGLHILYSLLKSLEQEAAAQSFYQTYYMMIVQHVLSVVTDTSHTAGTVG